MRNKKNGFFTFIFSLLPGAGEMYFGLYRQGLLLMSMFFGSIAICALTGMGELAFVLPIIWCFGFFHVHNFLNLHVFYNLDIVLYYILRHFVIK